MIDEEETDSEENDTTEEEESSINEPETTPVADGYEILGGVWEVGAIYYPERKMTIDIKDNDNLASMYSGVLITFSEDGTFFMYYAGLYPEKGNYQRYDSSDASLSKFTYSEQDPLWDAITHFEFFSQSILPGISIAQAHDTGSQYM